MRQTSDHKPQTRRELKGLSVCAYFLCTTISCCCFSEHVLLAFWLFFCMLLIKFLLQFLHALFIWSYAYLLTNEQGGIKRGNTILTIYLFQTDTVIYALTYIQYYTLPLSGKEFQSSISKLLRSHNSASEEKSYIKHSGFHFIWLASCQGTAGLVSSELLISGDAVILNESWKSHFFWYFKEDYNTGYENYKRTETTRCVA